MSNCPKCFVRIEKSAGCNHMTCRQCSYEWCWVCGSKFSPNHMNPINPFGCSGLLTCIPGNSKRILLWSTLNFIFLPITFFLIIALLSIYGLFELIKRINQCFGFSSSLLRISVDILIFCPLCLLTSAIAIIIYGILIVPTMVIQLYRMIKIFRIWCCKSNDKKRRRKAIQGS